MYSLIRPLLGPFSMFEGMDSGYRKTIRWPLFSSLTTSEMPKIILHFENQRKHRNEPGFYCTSSELKTLCLISLRAALTLCFRLPTLYMTVAVLAMMELQRNVPVPASIRSYFERLSCPTCTLSYVLLLPVAIREKSDEQSDLYWVFSGPSEPTAPAQWRNCQRGAQDRKVSTMETRCNCWWISKPPDSLAV